MKKTLSKEWSYGKDIAALIIRVIIGLSLFYGHGLVKWNILFGEGGIEFLDPLI